MIREISERIHDRSAEIDRWYQNRLSLLDKPPQVYSSVDIRNAGFKIGVVDTNLFPAGFNNLCETFSGNAAETFRNYFRRWRPAVRKILIFPEEHTRNLFYWKNVHHLQKILADAGFEVVVGSSSTVFTSDPTVFELGDGQSVEVYKLSFEGRCLTTKVFKPDAILINNDLTNGVPDYLRDICQVLLPSPHLGWYRRRKSEHFELYGQLIGEVSGLLEIDPWLLSPLTTVETGIDLRDEICLDRLSEAADRLLSEIRQKYLRHGIQKDPYLFVKHNTGTYGLGIAHVDSGQKLRNMNRRLRNQLEYVKGGQKVSEYILQEGIPTADLYRGHPIEPVVYMVGGEAVGTFFRIHESKGPLDNLNAPGMQFGCVCLHKIEKPRKNCQLTYENKDQLFRIASLLGRVASLASTLELDRFQKLDAA